MPYITCQLCGSGVVQSLDINICTRCIKTGNDQTKILAIKKYLQKHPEAKFQEVSRVLGIDRNIIDKFIKEGSLILLENNEETMDLNKAKEKRKNLIRQLSDMRNYSQQRFNKDERSQLLIDLEEKRKNERQR